MPEVTGGQHVITGATSDIGRAIAVALAEQGHEVAALGRNRKILSGLQAQFPKLVHTHAIDLREAADLERVAQATQSGGVAALIHCSGVYHTGQIASAPVADLDDLYQSNVRAPYALTQALLPGLIRARGHVIFINSSAGLSHRPRLSGYSATQHALRVMADSLRDEVNPQGVRVTSLYLGRTASQRMARIFAGEGRSYTPELLLQPEDIAATVLQVLKLNSRAEITDLSIRPSRKSY
ncbi:MAG TPA: SDR family NAD(P)-dependent oxidoreductase [Steroidobacteraceae bacterium]|nr:SDR family NAD(P)-dependent oxidoreductase [Steroidobacteraceae bacterium]